MRTLDELGISPAPWDYQPNNPQGITVADRGNWTIGCFGSKTDARLIAAAPELYEACRRVHKWISDSITNAKHTERIMDIQDAISDALAKASGESEEAK